MVGTGYSPGMDHLANILLQGLHSTFVFGHQFYACWAQLGTTTTATVTCCLCSVSAALCLLPVALCWVFTRSEAFQSCHAPCPFCLQGDSENYYDPSNSLLPFVLATRKGIPISLAIVHAAVGRRAGLPIEFVGMPMHFMNKLGAAESPDERFIDVFAGGKLLDRCDRCHPAKSCSCMLSCARLLTSNRLVMTLVGLRRVPYTVYDAAKWVLTMLTCAGILYVACLASFAVSHLRLVLFVVRSPAISA